MVSFSESPARASVVEQDQVDDAHAEAACSRSSSAAACAFVWPPFILAARKKRLRAMPRSATPCRFLDRRHRCRCPRSPSPERPQDVEQLGASYSAVPRPRAGPARAMAIVGAGVELWLGAA